MSNRTINTLSGSLAPVNAQLEKLQQNINDKLDRIPDSGQMNALEDTLDANSNKIINLPKPVDSTEPARLKELNETLASIYQIIEGTDIQNGSGTYNALAFDIPNDGTDIGDKLNTAIDFISNAGGGTLFFPAGTYHITTAVACASRVNIAGDSNNSRFTIPDGFNDNIFEASGIENVSISNIYVDGNGANQTAGSILSFPASSHVTIKGNTLLNAYAGAIAFPDGGATVEKCLITENYVEGNLTSYAVVVDVARDVVISDNTVINPAQSGIQVFISENCTVTGNTIKHTGTHGGGFGGIRLSATGGVVRNVSVTGNAIEGTSRGIFVGENISYSTLSGNTIRDIERDGIIVESTSSYISITGNTIQNVGSDSAGTYAGISVGGASSCSIVGNVISDSTASMAYAVNTGSASFGNTVLGNILDSGTLGDALSSPRNEYANNYSSKQRDIIATATSITVPMGGNIFTVTGAGTVENVNLGTEGREITLVFASGGITVSDGVGNLNLAGDFTPNNQDTLTLKYLNSSWFEISRSSN